MKRGEVTKAAGGLPYMSPEHADIITALILEHRLQRVLELGFHHGVSTCCIAAALDELGGGSLTTIDLEGARHLAPNVETLLRGLGLRHLVSVHYEPTSYLWRLMKMLEAQPPPRFDLCYIDGAHTWATDGLAQRDQSRRDHVVARMLTAPFLRPRGACHRLGGVIEHRIECESHCGGVARRDQVSARVASSLAILIVSPPRPTCRGTCTISRTCVTSVAGSRDFLARTHPS